MALATISIFAFSHLQSIPRRSVTPSGKTAGASEEQLGSCTSPLAPWKVAPLRLHPSATNHFSKAPCPDVPCSTAIKRNAIMSLYFKDVSIFLSTFLQIELCAEARGFEWSPDACVGLVGARGASDSGGKGQDGWRDARGQGRRGRLSCLTGPGGGGRIRHPHPGLQAWGLRFPHWGTGR